jgi:hypothetical protein
MAFDKTYKLILQVFYVNINKVRSYDRQETIKEMHMKLTNKLSIFVCVAAVTGCLNMPTPPSQITGSYQSGLRYEEFDCSKLSAELDSLARRENQLTIAQEQRVKSSQVQAFWWGFGSGDGVEASELASVKGEKEAVRKAIDAKSCI